MRAAIIGTGGIAQVHRRLILELGGQLVGVCGRTSEAARAFAPDVAYDDVGRMLGEVRPDVVHICSPNHRHAEHAIAAFKAGAHVICEKPLAVSSTECRRMIEAALRAGRIGAVAYCYRGYPLIEILRRKVAEGRFGRLRRVGGCYLSQDACDPERYFWHFTPGSVGPAHALMDIGVHWLDLVEHVTGDRIVEVMAQLTTHEPERVWRGLPGQGPRPPGPVGADGSVRVGVALDDQADLLIRTAGGAVGSATISCVAVGHPNKIVLSVDGSQAGFDWNQMAPNVYRERREDGVTLRQRDPVDLPPALGFMSALPPGHAEGYGNAFRNVVAQSWRAMCGEDGGYPSFEDGRRGVELVEAAVRSATERRPAVTRDQTE